MRWHGTNDRQKAWKMEIESDFASVWDLWDVNSSISNCIIP